MAKETSRPRLLEYQEKLFEFTDELTRWGKAKFLWEYGRDYTNVKFYTGGNQYHIRATPTYLGCTVSSRKSRPGEDWNRGNDLADGKLNKETWDLILRDIVAYELKSISDYILNPPTAVAEETK